MIEPVAVYMLIGSYSKDFNKVKRLRLQLNTIFGLVLTNGLWKHYLQLTLIDIKASKTAMLVRKNAAIKPQMVDAQIAEIKKEKVTPIGILACINPKKRGMALHVQKGVIIPNKLAKTFPKSKDLP